VNRLRVAVIGAGHLGSIHTRLISAIEQVQLVGVVDPSPEARRRVANEFETQSFSHHSEIIGQIDAAIVAVPTENHRFVGADLLAHGIHLFVEKPLASTLDEANELVQLANRRQLVLQVGHVERFNPAWQAAVPYIRRPRYIEAVRTSGYTGRSTDIGTVLDLMIHDLDLVLSQVRSEVVEVDAIGATIFGPHEDMAHAHLRFANGCIANLNASRTSFESQRRMQIVTSRGYVGIDFAQPSAKLVRPSKEVLRGEIDVQHLSPEQREWVGGRLFDELLPIKDLAVENRNAILDEQREFVDCIQHGKRPQVSGEEGRDCLCVAERILQRIRAASPSINRQKTEKSVPTLLSKHDWPSQRKAG